MWRRISQNFVKLCRRNRPSDLAFPGDLEGIDTPDYRHLFPDYADNPTGTDIGQL